MSIISPVLKERTMEYKITTKHLDVDIFRTGRSPVAVILRPGVAMLYMTCFGVTICLSEGAGVGGKELGVGEGTLDLFIVTGRLKS